MLLDGIDVGDPDEVSRRHLGHLLSSEVSASALVESLSQLTETDCIIYPTAEVSESASVRSSIIGPGVRIYEHVTVRNSMVMAGCQIGHASEVARSCLFPQASIPRFNYVGASIIGEASRLGGCVSAASRRFDSREVLLSTGIPTGRGKFGCIVGRDCLIGFGCHLNPGTLVGARVVIQPLIDVRGHIPPNSVYVVEQRTRSLRRRNFDGSPFPDMTGGGSDG